MSYYPSFEQLITSGEKTRLLQVKRSLRSIIPNIFYFLVSVFIVYLLNYYFYDYEPPQSIPVLKHLSVRWLAIIPIVFLIEIIRRYHDDLYIFEIQRLTHLEGRLSLSYSVPVINYIDIRAITVYQDIFGRIFDYGTVSIGTAAKDADELIISGIRAPVELAKLVDEFRGYCRAQQEQEGEVARTSSSND
jgi:membrane protein YdbS with pleckstrin-like domain